jgi:hypothetical protein
MPSSPKAVNVNGSATSPAAVMKVPAPASVGDL